MFRRQLSTREGGCRRAAARRREGRGVAASPRLAKRAAWGDFIECYGSHKVAAYLSRAAASRCPQCPQRSADCGPARACEGPARGRTPTPSPASATRWRRASESHKRDERVVEYVAVRKNIRSLSRLLASNRRRCAVINLVVEARELRARPTRCVRRRRRHGRHGRAASGQIREGGEEGRKKLSISRGSHSTFILGMSRRYGRTGSQIRREAGKMSGPCAAGRGGAAGSPAQ